MEQDNTSQQFFDTSFSQGNYRGVGRDAAIRKLNCELRPLDFKNQKERELLKKEILGYVELLSQKLLPERARARFENSPILDDLFIRLKL